MFASCLRLRRTSVSCWDTVEARAIPVSKATKPQTYWDGQHTSVFVHPSTRLAIARAARTGLQIVSQALDR